MSRTRSPDRRFRWGETRLLMEYLEAAYPGDQWLTNVHVGPYISHMNRDGLTDAELRFIGKQRRYADALVIQRGRVIVVEATMIRAIQKIGPLLEYVKLAPETPELVHLRALPVSGELVSPIPDPRVAALAAEVGLRFVVHRIAWMNEVVELYGRRFRRAPLSSHPTHF